MEDTGAWRGVKVVANNGTRGYNDLIALSEGCAAKFRFDENQNCWICMGMS